MNYFNIVQVRIALLALFESKNKGFVTSKKFKKTILFLEDFHFAYNAIVSGRASRFEAIYAKFAIQLRKCDNKVDAHSLVDEELISKLNALFPDFEEFSKGFASLTYTKKEKPNNIKAKYAIQRLNNHFDKVELFSDLGSVEHIVPESSDGNVFSIGNLILLEQDLNNKAGNTSYKDKRKFYERSSFSWIKEFTKDNENWNIENIDTRSRELAEVFYRDILKRNIKEK